MSISSRLPSRCLLPSISACAPLPSMFLNPVALASLHGAARRRIACAKGWSDPASTAAAVGQQVILGRVGGSPGRRLRLTHGQRAGLVEDDDFSLVASSSADAFLNRMPFIAPRSVLTMIAIGVASPSASGQAMTKTVIVG